MGSAVSALWKKQAKVLIALDRKWCHQKRSRKSFFCTASGRSLAIVMLQTCSANPGWPYTSRWTGYRSILFSVFVHLKTQTLSREAIFGSYHRLNPPQSYGQEERGRGVGLCYSLCQEDIPNSSTRVTWGVLCINTSSILLHFPLYGIFHHIYKRWCRKIPQMIPPTTHQWRHPPSTPIRPNRWRQLQRLLIGGHRSGHLQVKVAVNHDRVIPQRPPIRTYTGDIPVDDRILPFWMQFGTPSPTGRIVHHQNILCLYMAPQKPVEEDEVLAFVALRDFIKINGQHLESLYKYNEREWNAFNLYCNVCWV